nr:hypothetical protein CFP56_51251 [Quercus suber]
MFDDEVATANLAMVASTTTSTYFTIQFGSFKPIEIKVPSSLVPVPEDYIFSSLTCYQVSGEEDSSNNDTLGEAQVIVSPSSKEVNFHSKTSRIDSLIEEKEAKPIKEKETKQTKTSTKERKHEASKATKVAPMLHYVPIAKGKEGQYPFSGDEESILKDLQGLNLPVTKITKPRPSSQPLKGFTRPSQGPIVEHGILPTKRIEEGFDPNAYRFMAKAGYNHEKPSGLGKLIPESSGKEEHKVSKAKGFSVTSSKAGIGYAPPTPVHIPI